MREGDGTEFILIATTGATKLGRLLSEANVTNISSVKYGKFATLTGYIAFLKSGQEDSTPYQNLSYRQALTYNKRNGIEEVNHPNLTRLIQNALYRHVKRTPGLQEMLAESTLPFKGYRFHVNYFEKLRSRL